MDVIVLETGHGVRDLEVEADLPDGTSIVLSVNVQPLPVEGSPLGGLVVSFRDVTEAALESRRLVEREDRLAAAHAVAKLASWELLPDTDEVRIFQALPGDDALTGTTIPLDALLGDRDGEERDRTREDLAACLRGERDDTVRISPRVRPSGTVWLETRSRAVRDAEGRVISVRGTTQDVTEQELAKRETARARDFFQTTLDSLSAHIAVLDEHGAIILTNRAWRAFSPGGVEASTGVGANYLAVCDAAQDDPGSRRTAAALRAIIAGQQESFVDEYPCHGPDSQAWFAIRAMHFDGPGNARVVVSHEDVTARRQAQAQLTTHTALLDEIDAAVVATDAAGRVTLWNRCAEQLYGRTSAEVVGRDAARLLSPSEDDDIFLRYMADLQREGRANSLLELQHKDGSTFQASLHGRVMLDADGNHAGWISVSVDMTERVAAERALLAARNYMKAVTDSMGEALYTLDAAGRLIYMNEAAEKLLGFSQAELEGQIMHEMTHARHPDGTPHPIEDCPMWHARRDGQTRRVDDDIFIHRDGSEVPVAYIASPFETDEGIEGCAVVFSDISERKDQEKALRAEADKLKWIGRIQDALAEDRFVLYAQPIVDLATDEAVQSELLLRMREPDGRIIGPGEYLGVAEQYGMIGEIDRWVVERGLQIASHGPARGDQPLGGLSRRRVDPQAYRGLPRPL